MPLLPLSNKKVKIVTAGDFNSHFIKEPREAGLHKKMEIKSHKATTWQPLACLLKALKTLNVGEVTSGQHMQSLTATNFGSTLPVASTCTLWFSIFVFFLIICRRDTIRKR